jgi:hypothetical protein
MKSVSRLATQVREEGGIVCRLATVKQTQRKEQMAPGLVGAGKERSDCETKDKLHCLYTAIHIPVDTLGRYVSIMECNMAIRYLVDMALKSTPNKAPSSLNILSSFGTFQV